MKNRRRAFGLVALVSALTLALSGCFVISLADGRSPFDDPFGPSNGKVSEAVADVQKAIDAVHPPDDKLTVRAEEGSDNCEGKCNLRVNVSFYSADRYANVSAADLKSVIKAAVPVAEKHDVNIKFESVAGRQYPAPNGATSELQGISMRDAANQLFTVTKSRVSDGASFTAYRYSEQSVVVFAYTRSHDNVLSEMALQ